MILNCGCGSNKIPGAINIDINQALQPDLVCNFEQPLPFPSQSIEKIYLFHVIEHLPEHLHLFVLLHFHEVLIPHGILYVSYPEFTKCAQNFIFNVRGKRDFWKKTIYGRQSHKDDYHVSLMYTPYFIETLRTCGYTDIEQTSEPGEDYNTVIKARKGNSPMCLEDLYKNAFF